MLVKLYFLSRTSHSVWTQQLSKLRTHFDSSKFNARYSFYGGMHPADLGQ